MDVVKRTITLTELRNLLDTCDDDGLIGIRDAALILFGYALGRRRSEIASSVMEDLHQNADGSFTYNADKTKKNIVGMAALALKEWLKASQITTGPIFRGIPKGGNKISPTAISDKQVNRIVKSRCEKAGYDSSQFSTHSLRSAFVTESIRYA